ncbi:MAG: DEAD/DEAH box helicase [Lachnospiraceae bacterium]
MNTEIEIKKGLDTAFLNQYSYSNLAYRPEFIANDHLKGRKVLSTLEDELKSCEEFYISVAFITMGGITPLLQTLKELESRNIKGKIITTDYLTFSDPKALKKLAELKNIELRMFCVEKEQPGFHTKGYIFKNRETYKIVVGSSNLTLLALTKNKEWNTKIVAKADGEYTNNIVHEFQDMWKQSRKLDEWIDTYSRIYEEHKKAAQATKIVTMPQIKLIPNAMQISFIQNLKKLIDAGKKRALLISSTGTGKTIASAFALQDNKPKKALFIVHREQILDQAIKSYQDVFGDTKSYGKLTGTQKDFDSDFLFSTMSMMAKKEIMEKFEKDEFQIIVIDEVHRAGAVSYQTIMDYFTPDLWLGMTASPDRPDGYDIYRLFDNNIAYEIRLQKALEENLLCPFHYFGITELEINGQTFEDVEELRNFNYLISDRRVDYIIEKAEYFGHSGDRVKGLVFCVSKKEASELSNQFNRRGYRTIALTGEDSVDKREMEIEHLVCDNQENELDYIFTVDIFNEGVDIPEVNQVIMLRPTESPIIFIQQLGRGLRKADNKEYVVVLDFIGNYSSNFMIPIALSGDRSRSKDNLRKYIAEGTRVIPGCSSIHFDEITKERIYKSINMTTLNKVEDIKYEYKCLRNKLGRIPTYMDFEDYNTIDIECIFENSSLGSYHNFLKKYESEYKYKEALNSVEEEMLVFVSRKIANGKRIDELLLLKRLLKYNLGLKKMFKNDWKQKNGIEPTEQRINNVCKMLTNDFLPSISQKGKFSQSVFVKLVNGEIEATEEFKQQMDNPIFCELMDQLVEYGIFRHKMYYGNRYRNTDFVLYQKYTKSDVCRLLNWEKNQNPQNIGGYFYDKRTQTLPIFITYKKNDDVVNSQNYEDRFISPTELISISKSGRNFNSPEMSYFYDDFTSIYLFMQKNSNDKGASEYYFMGQMKNTGDKKIITRKEVGDTVLEFRYQLETPVREDLYQYFSQDAIPIGEKE